MVRCGVIINLLIALVLLAYSHPDLPLPMLLMAFDREMWALAALIHLLLFSLIAAGLRLPTWAAFARKILFSYSLFAFTFIVISLFHPLFMTTIFPQYGYVTADRHPIVGHHGRPGGLFWHWCQEFNVIYHYDQAGWRVQPVSPTPKGNVVFLGCSYTFGHGVPDNDTLTHHLGQTYWPGTSVENLATSSWGTFEAWYVLRDRLGSGDHLSPRLLYLSRGIPQDIFYCWIPDHLRRYGGVDALGLKNREPIFARGADGLLLLEGFRQSVAQAQDNFEPALDLLDDMNARCRKAGSRFHLVLLNSPKPQYLEQEFVDAAAKRGIDLVDLRDVSDDFYPLDGHPRSGWHAAIARALAERFPHATLTEQSTSPKPAIERATPPGY